MLGRIEASLENPLALENAGHALFDLIPERRGNIFADEVGLSNYLPEISLCDSAGSDIPLPSWT